MDKLEYQFYRGKVARVGCQQYGDSYEFRSVEEVRQAYENLVDRSIPLLLEPHPQVVMNPKTIMSRDIVGTCYGWEFDGEYLYANIDIYRQDAIAYAEEAGGDSLSAGYLCFNQKVQPSEWRDTKGLNGIVGEIYNYDTIQTDIDIDHVVLCINPRGVTTKLIGDNMDNNKTNKQDSIVSGGMETPAHIMGLQAFIDWTDSFKAQQDRMFGEFRNEMIGMSTSMEALKAMLPRLDAVAPTPEVNASEDIQKFIAQEYEHRIDAIATLSKIDSADITESFDKYKGTPSVDLKKQVLAAHNIKCDSFSDEAVNGAYQVVKSMTAKTPDVSQAKRSDSFQASRSFVEEVKATQQVRSDSQSGERTLNVKRDSKPKYAQ